jgi:hypothetical protein
MLVDACLNDPKIVYSGEQMLVDQMETTFWCGRALLLAIFDKTAISLLTFSFEGLPERIVVFINMQIQEVCSWEVLVARSTSI